MAEEKRPKMKKIKLGYEKGKLRVVAAQKEGKKITELPEKENSKAQQYVFNLRKQSKKD